MEIALIHGSILGFKLSFYHYHSKVYILFTLQIYKSFTTTMTSVQYCLVSLSQQSRGGVLSSVNFAMKRISWRVLPTQLSLTCYPQTQFSDFLISSGKRCFICYYNIAFVNSGCWYAMNHVDITNHGLPRRGLETPHKARYDPIALSVKG